MQSREVGELLPWDTAFWGVTIGRVRGDALTQASTERLGNWARGNSVDCVYLRARCDDPQTIRVAEDDGFRLVEVRVGMALEPVVAPPSPPAVPVRVGVAEDVPDLQRIALTSYGGSRFSVDGRFLKERCAAYYATWIERATRGEFDDVALVVVVDGRAVGYLTCNRPDEEGRATLGLMAVDDAMRRRGLGSALLEEAIRWEQVQGARLISIRTQGHNIATQRLFLRHGFVPEVVHLLFHKWYTGEAA